MQLLTKSLKHTVNGCIEIHDGDERRENANIFCRFRAFINENAERLGKTDENTRSSNAKDRCQEQCSPHDVADVSVFLHGSVRCRKLRKLGDDQSREGCADGGRKEDQRKDHAVDRTVGSERRAVIRAVLAESDRNENVLNGDESRAQIRGQRDR